MLDKLLRAAAITALLTFLAQGKLLPTVKLPQTADYQSANHQPLQQANLNRKLP